MEQFDLVFDFATALSIFFAIIAFFVGMRIENKKHKIESEKKLQGERVTKVFGVLDEFRREHLEVFSKAKNDSSKEKPFHPGPILTDTALFLRTKVLPVFVVFTTKENLENIEEMIDATNTCIDAWSSFLETKDTEAISKATDLYHDSMMELEFKLNLGLRKQIYNEEESDSKKVAELYRKLKYTYRVVEFS